MKTGEATMPNTWAPQRTENQGPSLAAILSQQSEDSVSESLSKR